MANDLNLKISANAKEANSQLDKLTNNAKRLSSAGSKLNNGLKNSNKNFNGMHKQLRNINVDANRVTNSVGKMTSGFSRFNNMLKTVNVALLAHASATAIQSSLDMIETTNLYSVSLGEVAVEANKALVAMSEISGLDLTTLQNAQGTFALLARSMGVSTEKAQILSENAVKLAVDLSSLMNVPFAQAMADLKSGFVGQTETVYKYGLDLTEASLEQEAMRLGIEKSVRTMSQGEKMILRYTASVRNSALAQGDFAKTIETPANQLRILGERFTTLGRSIGTVFLGAISSVLPYLNAIVSVLTVLINLVASFFGYEPEKIKDTTNGFSGMADAIDGATDSTSKLNKELKNITAPFDELNTISEPSDKSGAGTQMGISPELLNTVTGYDNILSSVKQKSSDIRDNIMNWLGYQKQVNEETGETNWELEQGYTNIEKIRDLLIVVGTIVMGKLLLPKFVRLGELIIGALTISGEFIKIWRDFSLAQAIGWFTGLTISTSNLLIALAPVAGLLLIMATRTYDLWQNNENFVKGIERLGELKDIALIPLKVGFETLKTAISNLLPDSVVKVFKDFFDDLSTFMENAGIDFSDLLITLGGIALLFTGAGTPFGIALLGFEAISIGIRKLGGISDEEFEQMKTDFTDFTTSLTKAETWQNILKTTKENLNPISKVYETFFKELKTKMEETPLNFDTMMKGVKTFFEKGYKELKIFWDTFIAPIFTKDFWVNLGTDLKEGWRIMWTGAVNIGIGILNQFIDWVNELFNFSWEAVVVAGKQLMPAGSIQLVHLNKLEPIKLARGGMLDGGQSFIAGEMGKAELVGSYQNKTTVMPLENSGFVEAMYKAVYSAVTSAQEKGGSVIENVVQLDGQVIYKNQQKIAKSKGVNFGISEFAR